MLNRPQSSWFTMPCSSSCMSGIYHRPVWSTFILTWLQDVVCKEDKFPSDKWVGRGRLLVLWAPKTVNINNLYKPCSALGPLIHHSPYTPTHPLTHHPYNRGPTEENKSEMTPTGMFRYMMVLLVIFSLFPFFFFFNIYHLFQTKRFLDSYPHQGPFSVDINGPSHEPTLGTAWQRG